PEDCAPPPGEDELTPEEFAEFAEIAGSTGPGWRGRRGPGQPGSARIFPGESCSRAAAFGTGMALDVMPGAPELALFADQAAGDDESYQGASDDELVGVLCAWERLEVHMVARKLAAAAELIRRCPERGCPPEGPARMPTGWDEFTVSELALALAESRGRTEGTLTLALDLAARVPGTKAALRD